MPEVWKEVPDFDGRYQVSDQGRVMSNAKGAWALLRLVNQNTGYFTAHLHKAGSKPRIIAVHRLVATAFLGDPTGYVIRHLDGNSHNNKVENLAIGTVAENNRDIVRHGRSRNANATHCLRGHPFTEEHVYHRPDRKGRYCKTCAKQNRQKRKAARANG